MNRLISTGSSIPMRTRARFPRNFIELLWNANPDTIRLSILAVVAGWVPLFGLSVVQGWFVLKSFLSDSAAQSRLLLVIPLLILTEPQLAARLSGIARHFLAADLLKKEKMPQFEQAIASLERRGDSKIARIVIALLIYAFVGLAIRYAKPGLFPPWCYEKNDLGQISAAGFWYIFVSLPMVIYLLAHWIWRQLVWTGFLQTISRMGLRLIPSHPDLMGGLSFVETSIRGYLPFGFAVGTIAAGAVANQMFRFQQPLAAFKNVPLVVIAIVVLVCSGPLFSLYSFLLRTRRQGIFEYGCLANRVGHQFEAKWLNREVDDAALDAPDFSATIDLYSVVGNVRQMRVVPISLQSLVRLIAVTLAPALPVALVAVPFDVLIQSAIKYLA